MTLTGMQRRRLRALAQPRPARVRVGKRGPTDALLAELDAALAREGLVKVQWPHVGDEDASALAARIGAELAGRVGGALILYRAGPSAPPVGPAGD